MHTLISFLPCKATCCAVLPRQVVCPSVCNVEVSWSYRLECLANNFTADKPNLFALCRPQNDGSTPKGTPPNFSRNRSGIGKRKNVDFHSQFPVGKPPPFWIFTPWGSGMEPFTPRGSPGVGGSPGVSGKVKTHIAPSDYSVLQDP